MEENQDHITQWARNSGLTEDEAKILEHLELAAELYDALPDNYDKNIIEWSTCHGRLVRLLMWRIVKRDHPEGWISALEQEDRDLAAEGEDEPTP